MLSGGIQQPAHSALGAHKHKGTRTRALAQRVSVVWRDARPVVAGDGQDDSRSRARASVEPRQLVPALLERSRRVHDQAVLLHPPAPSRVDQQVAIGMAAERSVTTRLHPPLVRIELPAGGGMTRALELGNATKPDARVAPAIELRQRTKASSTVETAEDEKLLHTHGS